MKVLAYPLALLALASPAFADSVLLDFTADWCGPCRDMAPIVAGLEREGYRVERINIDRNPDRQRQFGVRNIPTFVVLREGRETGRVVGTTSAEALRRLLGPLPAARANGPSARPAPQSTTKAVAETSASRPADSRVNPALETSVRLVVTDTKATSFATGTVIRSVPGESLVLTCAHLFEGNSPNAKLTVEFFAASAPPPAPGELVARDPTADLALVRVAAPQPLPVAPVATRRFLPAPGLPAASVGCNNGSPATVWQMRITAVNRYLGPSTIECTGQPVQGRSGGGLFNQSGELIGVCSAADPAEHRGIYVGLAAVHGLLDRQGLAGLYRPAQAAAPRIVAASHETKPAETPITVPPPEKIGLGVAAQLSPPAAPADAEVVCVIRPIGDPRAQPTVVVLERASDEFLAQLERERRTQEGRTTTSMRSPSRPGTPGSRPSAILGADPGWRSTSREPVAFDGNVTRTKW